MLNPSDFLPTLIEYGNIAHEFLSRYLTDDQICSYLDLFNTPSMTARTAHKIITEEHGCAETVYYALDSLARINGLCNAAECPSDEPIDPNRAFNIAVCALQAGTMIGAVIDSKGREELFALAMHGKKFAEQTGRKPDKFTNHLESIVNDYYQQNKSFPNYMKVIRILEQQQGNGFIHTVTDDNKIEWGDKGLTPLPILKNKLSIIRKKIKSR